MGGLTDRFFLVKTLQSLLKELAVVQADKIKAEKPKYAVVHRKDGDSDFVNALLSELASEVFNKK